MSKRCSICGKYLSHMNLDFNRKIICSSCLLRPGKILHKKKEDEDRYKTDIYFVKRLYEAVKSGEIFSVDAIDCLERSIRKSFDNTRDFHKKMKNFLDKNYYKGVDLRRARKKSEMDRQELAWWLDVSIHRIKQMETNEKPLSRESIDFIRVMGFKKTVPLKKKEKQDSGKDENKAKKTETDSTKEPILKEHEMPDYEERWYKEKNPLCLECRRGCKQSKFVEIECCPQFKKKTEKVDLNYKYAEAR